MTIRNLEALFRPASLAVVGPDRFGGEVPKLLLSRLAGGGFSGEMATVACPAEEGSRIRAVGTIAELPFAPDLALYLGRPGKRPGRGRGARRCRHPCRRRPVARLRPLGRGHRHRDAAGRPPPHAAPARPREPGHRRAGGRPGRASGRVRGRQGRPCLHRPLRHGGERDAVLGQGQWHRLFRHRLARPAHGCRRLGPARLVRARLPHPGDPGASGNHRQSAQVPVGGPRRRPLQARRGAALGCQPRADRRARHPCRPHRHAGRSLRCGAGARRRAARRRYRRDVRGGGNGEPGEAGGRAPPCHSGNRRQPGDAGRRPAGAAGRAACRPRQRHGRAARAAAARRPEPRQSADPARDFAARPLRRGRQGALDGPECRCGAGGCRALRLREPGGDRRRTGEGAWRDAIGLWPAQAAAGGAGRRRAAAAPAAGCRAHSLPWQRL